MFYTFKTLPLCNKKKGPKATNNFKKSFKSPMDHKKQLKNLINTMRKITDTEIIVWSDYTELEGRMR